MGEIGEQLRQWHSSTGWGCDLGHRRKAEGTLRYETLEPRIEPLARTARTGSRHWKTDQAT